MTIFNKKRGITNNKFHNLNQNSNLHICMVILKKSEPNTFHKLRQQICLLKKIKKKNILQQQSYKP